MKEAWMALLKRIRKNKRCVWMNSCQISYPGTIKMKALVWL